MSLAAALAAALSLTAAAPCLAQASYAGQPVRPSAPPSSAAQTVRTASSAEPDTAPPPTADTESPRASGAVAPIPNTSSPETPAPDGPLSGSAAAPFGLAAIVAWAALALALAACGLFAWQRYMSPLRSAALEELESDLRDLVRQELNARQDSQIGALKAQIAKLEARIAELEGAHPAPFPGTPAAAAGEAPARPRGPAPIPADYFDDNRGEPRPRAAQRGPGPRPAAPPVRDFTAPQPSPPPRAARSLIQGDPVASLKTDAEYARLVELYRRCLAGERGALADFSEMHLPVGVVEDADGRFVESDDPEPAIWFVEVAGSDTHGVLLPARKVMRDWDRSYRPMSGHKATAVFGSSYDILPGERLSVTNPAWAQRTGPNSFVRVARGEMIGR